MDDGRQWVANTTSPLPISYPLVDVYPVQAPARRFAEQSHRGDKWLANPGGIEPVMAVGVMKPTGMASAAM